MNEELEKEKSAAAAKNTADKNTFLAEIERLHIQGHPARKIAEMLGTDGYLMILNVLTQDQVDGLSDDQLERMRAAIEGFRKEVDALRRKEREEQERQEAAVLDAGEQAQPRGESPPAALAPEAGPA